MDVQIAEALPREREFVGGGPEVALPEEEDLELVGEQDPHSDIEFPAREEQWLLHVFLDDEGTGPDGEVACRLPYAEGFLEDGVRGLLAS